MATGTFTNHPHLVKDFPRLLKEQRRLAKLIAVDPKDVKQEKAIRGDMDALMVADNFTNGETVTCDGAVITHHVRAGQARLDPEPVDAYLEKTVGRAEADALITLWTITGPDAVYCSVKEPKGKA